MSPGESTAEWAARMAREKRRQYMRQYLKQWRADHPDYNRQWLRARYVPARAGRPGYYAKKRAA